jgi:hypothetical protein
MPEVDLKEDNTKWTIETYAKHNEAMRKMEEKILIERDRRYAEVNIERQKALTIKETADSTALELAREAQVYKDERNDAIREQSLKQTGLYATHQDVAVMADKIYKALEPLADFVTSQQGIEKETTLTTTKIVQIIGAICAITGIFITLIIKFVK